MFRTNDELYEYLKFLMENNCEVKDERNPQKLTAEQFSANLELQITTAMILGASKTINRSIQLEDIARLENIINVLYRRVEDLESRIVPREQSVRLKELKFQKPTNTAAFTFTNNDRTCANNGSYFLTVPLSINMIVIRKLILCGILLLVPHMLV
jgi:hypothetical protein